jgi:hypothetical protein
MNEKDEAITEVPTRSLACKRKYPYHPEEAAAELFYKSGREDGAQPLATGCSVTNAQLSSHVPARGIRNPSRRVNLLGGIIQLRGFLSNHCTRKSDILMLQRTLSWYCLRLAQLLVGLAYGRFTTGAYRC